VRVVGQRGEGREVGAVITRGFRWVVEEDQTGGVRSTLDGSQGSGKRLEAVPGDATAVS
jgi:hypothetical protein